MPAIEALRRSAPGELPRVAFLGDSITQAGNWEQWFPHYEVLNLGVNGDLTRNVLERLERVLRARPQVISLLIGTNDLGNENRPVDEVAADTATILRQIKTALPDARVLLQSVLPRAAEFTRRIGILNTRNKALALEHGCAYLDLWPALADTGHNAIDSTLTDDFLHLNDAGYEQWLSLLVPELAALVKAAPAAGRAAHV